MSDLWVSSGEIRGVSRPHERETWDGLECRVPSPLLATVVELN